MSDKKSFSVGMLRWPSLGIILLTGMLEVVSPEDAFLSWRFLGDVKFGVAKTKV